MKKFFTDLKNKANEIVINFKCKALAAKEAVANKSGEGYVDTGIKIIIAVVVGAVILGGLYALFKITILPRLNTEVSGMFDYAG